MTNWTNQMPKEPGFYFAKRRDDHKPTVIQLPDTHDNDPILLWVGSDEYHTSEECAALGYQFWPERIEPPFDVTAYGVTRSEALRRIKVLVDAELERIEPPSPGLADRMREEREAKTE